MLRETPAAPSGTPLKSDRTDYNAAIEWPQALKEQGTRDAAEILSLKYVGGATTVVSEYATSAVAAPLSGSADLAALHAMVDQLAATVATLSKTIRRGDGRGGGRDKRKPKSGGGDGGAGDNADTNRVHLWDQKDPPKGTSKFPHCHLFVYHKLERCFKLEANTMNRTKMW